MQMELFGSIVQNTGECWRETICKEEAIYSCLQHKLYISLHTFYSLWSLYDDPTADFYWLGCRQEGGKYSGR